jgi:outer membrane lipopolysaccharide assembly protein LptE/RlpB
MHSRLFRISLLVCFSLFGLFACGYGFQGSGSVLPNDIKTLAIRRSANLTTVPGIGLQFTEKLVSRFSRYGVVEVVGSGKDADAELVTSIKNVQVRVRDTTGETDIALEYDMEFTVSAILRRRNGQVLYKNDGIKSVETFGGQSDVVVTSSSDFAQGGISADTLSSLSAREVTRGQGRVVLDDLMDESARKLYLDSVAASF